MWLTGLWAYSSDGRLWRLPRARGQLFRVNTYRFTSSQPLPCFFFLKDYFFGITALLTVTAERETGKVGRAGGWHFKRISSRGNLTLVFGAYLRPATVVAMVHASCVTP